MRMLLVSALALGALTSAAVAAEPLRLSDAQLDDVTAGQLTVVDNTSVTSNLTVDAATGLSSSLEVTDNLRVEFEGIAAPIGGGGGGGGGS